MRNKKGTTALMRAAQEGHGTVVQRLLLDRCDVNARNEDGMNALMLGSQRGHHEIVRELIEHKAAIDGRTVQVGGLGLVGLQAGGKSASSASRLFASFECALDEQQVWAVSCCQALWERREGRQARRAIYCSFS